MTETEQKIAEALKEIERLLINQCRDADEVKKLQDCYKVLTTSLYKRIGQRVNKGQN